MGGSPVGGILRCSPSQGQQIKNLLVNGGFETGSVSPWTTYGTVTKEVVTTLVGATVPENPVEGSCCLHVTVPKAAVSFWDIGLWSPKVVLAKGKKYTFSVFLKSKAGSVPTYFALELAVSPWTACAQRSTTMSNTWAEYYITTPVFDSDVSPASIVFHIGFAAAEFWIDDIRLYEGDYVPASASEAIPAVAPPRNTVAGNYQETFYQELSDNSKLALRRLFQHGDEISQYGLFTVDLDIAANYDNPFDPEQIEIVGQFTTPSGRVIEVPAFFYRCFEGEVSPFANRGRFKDQYFKLRFTPTEVGAYACTIHISNKGATAVSDKLLFRATESGSKGFIHVDPDSTATYLGGESRCRSICNRKSTGSERNCCYPGSIRTGSIENPQYLSPLSSRMHGLGEVHGERAMGILTEGGGPGSHLGIRNYSVDSPGLLTAGPPIGNPYSDDPDFPGPNRPYGALCAGAATTGSADPGLYERTNGPRDATTRLPRLSTVNLPLCTPQVCQGLLGVRRLLYQGDQGEHNFT